MYDYDDMPKCPANVMFSPMLPRQAGTQMPTAYPYPLGGVTPTGIPMGMPTGAPTGPAYPAPVTPPGGIPTGPAFPPAITPGGIPSAAPAGEFVPPSVQSTMYLAGFLKTQIGRRVRVEFLIGTNGTTDRTGTLVAVGASYIILQEPGEDNMIVCDLYSIKFVTVYF